MALVASLREVRCDVVRIGGALEILQVATYAGCGANRVVVVDVAIGALARRHGVQSRQRKARRGVVELAIGPLHHVMTLFARCRKAAVGNRCARAGEILLVTAVTRKRTEGEIVVGMAVLALTGRNRVSSSENKSGCAVIEAAELGVQPVVGGVARFAGSRKFRRDVIRVRSSRKVRLVAGEACRRHRLEFAVSPALVAGVAIDGSVGASQWESIVVLLHILNCDLPSSDGVALFAIGAQLALVDVGMAVLAALTDIRENHLYVAGRAGHRSMHAAQRIPCLVVIELGNGPDRLPPIRGMAVLAGKSQIAVRTVRAFGGLRPRASGE